MNTNHTPGPWQVGEPVAATRDLGPEWTTVCSLSPEDGEPNGIVAYVHKDNAPIVAAAPDMLAALQLAERNAASRLHFLPLSADQITRASLNAEMATYRAAIAKAQDRAP